MMVPCDECGDLTRSDGRCMSCFPEVDVIPFSDVLPLLRGMYDHVVCRRVYECGHPACELYKALTLKLTDDQRAEVER